MRKTALIVIFFVFNFLFPQNKKEGQFIYNELLKIDQLSKSKDKNIDSKLNQIFLKLGKNESDSLKGFYYLIRANTFSDQLKKEEAIKAITLSNQFYTKAKNSSGISKSFMNLGNLYLYKGDFEKALVYYNKGLEIAEKNNLYKEMGFINKNIGVVFMSQEKYKEALLYSNKALDIFLKINNKKEIAGAYINIGNVYFNQYDADNALLFYKKAEKICLEINDDFNLGLIYNNIGSVYAEDKNDKVNGLKYLKKALQLKIANNDTNEIIFQHTNLADFYTNDNDFVHAEFHLKKAEIMALKSNNKVELKQIYSTYANMYEKKNDFKSALFNYKLHSKYKDSILNIESLKSVKELETKYQTAKKEKLLLEKEAEAKQKNIILTTVSLFALFIAIIGLLIYRQQKLKHRQQAQEFELKSAISQIENQNKLQEQRLNISRDLHDNIGSQLTFIISSVDNVKYAFDIDNKKLDDKLTNISSFAKETIVELRDTIWAMNSNEISFEDLESRINNFIEKAKDAKDEIQFSFETDIDLKDTKLTSVEGMNIYRTIQEAINNAIKYADATTISIAVKKIETQIQITIQDNGIGFEQATIEKGNGLQNMQKRIEDIGGKFSLESSNQGTTITMVFKY